MRHPLIIGNWKLNGSKQLVKTLINELQKECSEVVNCKVAIAPPVIYIEQMKQHLHSKFISLGAQNVDVHLMGAFTGEISATMLKDLGVTYVIIGHSERRVYHKENDYIIAQKFAVLKETGLIPVLCIGESEEERKNGTTKMVCIRQLDTIIDYSGNKAFENAVIAYEPRWAIGSGKSANPYQVQEVHQFIRCHIAQYDFAIAKKTTIQYGGSVNDANVNELLKQPDVDGVLVGTASLAVSSFSRIIRIAEQERR